jgi:peptide/nickel transport system permease protein
MNVTTFPTPAPIAASATAPVALPPPSSFLQRFCRNRTALISALILLAIVAIAILAPYIAPHDPARSSLRNILKPPSAAYLLGSDDLGRDVLSRLMFASRLSLVASVQAVAIALAIGLPLGLIAGYIGGWVDTVISRVNDALMSFPALILAVVIVGLIGPSLSNAMTAIGLVYAPRIMRVVRGSTLSVREEVYVRAARALGCSDARIVALHVLPNVTGPLVVQATVLMGQALLGSGAQLPRPGRAATGSQLGRHARHRLPLHGAIANPNHRRRRGDFRHRALLQPHRRRHSRFRRPHAPGGRLSMAEPMKPLLEIRDLTVQFPSSHGWLTVVDNVSVSVGRNDIVCIVGESGSGKSVTTQAAVGLVQTKGGRLKAGSVMFDGQELVGMANRQLNRIRGNDIGFIFQEPMSSLNPAYTVGEQIAEVVRRHRGASRAEAWQHAVRMLDRVHIASAASRAHDYPHQFSGGMRQRVMIAMSIACDPKLLIADEPTTALDVTIQARILELMKEVQRDSAMSVLFITHDLGVVADIAKSVVVMYGAQVVESAPVDELFASPRHPYTAGLLGAMPQVALEKGIDPISIPGTVAQPHAWPAGCRFNPRCTYRQDGPCTTTPIPLERDDHGLVRCVRSNSVRPALSQMVVA